MELRAGYKKTEVGFIPEEWEVKSLGEEATFRTGPFGSALHKSDYTSDGVPVINPMHILDGRLVPTSTMSITEKAAQQLGDFRLKANEIIIGRRGDMGRCAVVKEDQSGWLCGTGSMIVRCSRSTDPEFLQRILSSSTVVAAIEETSVGSTMINLNQSTLSGLRLQFPPTPEQRAISAALSDVDALIVSLDRLILKKLDMKQAAMRELLTGKRRLAGFSGEWKVKILGAFGKCIRGVSYKGDADLSPHDTLNTIRLLRSNNVQSSTVVKSNLQFVASVRVSEHQVMRDGDILVCMANGSKELVGKAGKFVANDSYEYTFGAFMGCFRTDTGAANATFIFYLFQTGQYRNYIANLLAGSSINNMKPSDIESMAFKVPSSEEQAAIATILSDMDADITTMEQKLNKTRMMKQGMMQELLTGKIRLA